MYLMHCLSMKRPAKIKLNMFLTFWAHADQSSNGNRKEEIKNECLMNDKAEEERLENNFSIFEYVKFSDCEINVFVNGLK